MARARQKRGRRLPPFRGKAFGIVVSRFNEFITKRLLTSALETFKQHGVSRKAIEIIWVPGALEAPFFAKKLAGTGRFGAVIVLSCILRGDTKHFENVSHEIVRGVSQAALETGVPMASGIIVAETLEQAVDRAGPNRGNKGGQAALAAMEIADLNKILSGTSPRRDLSLR